MSGPDPPAPRDSRASASVPRGGSPAAPQSASPASGAQRAEGERSAGPRKTGAEGERSQKSWRVLDLLRWTTDHFRDKGIETARLDAECLLAFALGLERLELYLQFEKPVTPGERSAFRELVMRRAGERVPVAQLTGRKEFWSLPLRITPDVLTPRPETETLVAAALELVPEAEAEARILDLGTGSGAIALALARERPRARVTASDVSGAALRVARANAEALELADRVRWLEGRLFEPVAGERFELVVSNPPYVRDADRGSLDPELAHEPEGALFAGSEGLDVLEPLARQVPDLLAAGGAVALEVAPEQASRVAGWCREAGLLSVTKHRDLAGRERVVTARGEG